MDSPLENKELPFKTQPKYKIRLRKRAERTLSPASSDQEKDETNFSETDEATSIEYGSETTSDFEYELSPSDVVRDFTNFNLFDCDLCEYSTNDKSNLRRHMKIHEKTGSKSSWFKCDVCSYKSRFKHNVEKHKKIHVDSDLEEWFECDQCPFKTRENSNLKRHLKIHLELESEDNTAPEVFFQCALCPVKTKRRDNLTRHMDNMHKGEAKKFPCEHCDHVAKSDKDLRQHLSAEHHEAIEIKWFSCEDCTYKSKREYGLQRHVRTIHGRDLIFKCETCSFETNSKRDLGKHNREEHKSGGTSNKKQMGKK